MAASCFATVAARAGDDDPLSYHFGNLYLGDCKLEDDPDGLLPSKELGILACARGSVGAEITAVSGTPAENNWIRYGSAALGIYIYEWLSLQGRATFREERMLEKTGRRDLYRDMDYAVLQAGNPAINRVWIDVGRAPLPFGFNLPVASETYQLHTDTGFWQSPRYGATMAIDNKVNTRLDIGYGTDRIRGRVTSQGDLQAEAELPSVPTAVSPDDPRNRIELTAVAARLTYDVSALDGTRIEVSGYGANHGERRYGLGLMTISRRNDLTELEFVRRQGGLENPSGDFAQIVRLGYRGAWRGSSRLIVELDDERFQHRMGTLGADLRAGLVIVKLSVAYSKSETGDGLHRWSITSGLEVHL